MPSTQAGDRRPRAEPPRRRACITRSPAITGNTGNTRTRGHEDTILHHLPTMQRPETFIHTSISLQQSTSGQTDRDPAARRAVRKICPNTVVVIPPFRDFTTQDLTESSTENGPEPLSNRRQQSDSSPKYNGDARIRTPLAVASTESMSTPERQKKYTQVITVLRTPERSSPA